MTEEELAQQFKEAGYGHVGVVLTDLGVIGIDKVPKTYRSKNNRILKPQDDWEHLCAFVIEKATGEPAKYCNLHGRGFRSQWWGREAHDAIMEKQNEI